MSGSASGVTLTDRAKTLNARRDRIDARSSHLRQRRRRLINSCLGLKLRSKKSIKARAFAVAARPVGNTAHRSRGGRTPFRQHRAHGTRAQFRGEHPFGCDGKPSMGEHCGSNCARVFRPRRSQQRDASHLFYVVFAVSLIGRPVGAVAIRRLTLDAHSRCMLKHAYRAVRATERLHSQSGANTKSDPRKAATTSRSEIEMRSRSGNSPSAWTKKPPSRAPIGPNARFLTTPNPLRFRVMTRPARPPPRRPTIIQTMNSSNVGTVVFHNQRT